MIYEKVLSHACTEKYTYLDAYMQSERATQFPDSTRKRFWKEVLLSKDCWTFANHFGWAQFHCILCCQSDSKQTMVFLRLSGFWFVTIQFPAQRISHQYDCVYTNTHWHIHPCSQRNMRWQFVLWQPPKMVKNAFSVHERHSQWHTNTQLFIYSIHVHRKALTHEQLVETCIHSRDIGMETNGTRQLCWISWFDWHVYTTPKNEKTAWPSV